MSEVYDADRKVCCHSCGYSGTEATYPEICEDNEAYYKLDEDGNFLWNEDACPECGSVEQFGSTSSCWVCNE